MLPKNYSLIYNFTIRVVLFLCYHQNAIFTLINQCNWKGTIYNVQIPTIFTNQIWLFAFSNTKIIFWNVIPLQKCCHSQIDLLLPPRGGPLAPPQLSFNIKELSYFFTRIVCTATVFSEFWIPLSITCKIHVIKKQDGTSLVLLFPWNKDGTVYINQQAPSSTFSAVTLLTIRNGRCNAGFLHWWSRSYAIVHENGEQTTTTCFLKDKEKKFDQHHQPIMVEWACSVVL